MDVAYNRHAPSTRRSHPSLNHLSLAPLTPKFPIGDADELPDPNTPSITYKSSYIEGRSAPTAPSILSRSSSRTRLRPNKSTHTLKDFNSPVPKSKSSVSITLPSHQSARPKSSTPAIVREDSEWLHRAGALISTSTRESKGQAWLATRSSSTSLVEAGDREDADGEVADDEFSPISRRNSASRPGSRFASARNSRRGSRVGSRVELLTPMEARTPREVEGGEGTFGEGPDFVDGVEEDEGESADEEEVDEKELQRLTREKGFGLGGWVDKLIGWTMFKVEDDERGESDGEVDDQDAEQVRSESKGRAKRQDTERVMVAPSNEDREVVPPPEEGEGGWRDAAWLLSVASKIML